MGEGLIPPRVSDLFIYLKNELWLCVIAVDSVWKYVTFHLRMPV